MATTTEDVKLTLRISDEGTVQVLDAAGRKLDELGSKTERASGAFTKTGASIVTFNQALDLLSRGAQIAGQAFEAVLQPISRLDRLGELSQITQLSARDLSTFGTVARQSGIDIESFGSSMGIFSTKIVEAQDRASTTGKVFAALGIDVSKTGTDVAKNLEAVAGALSRLPDGAGKLTELREFFGRGGPQQAAFLNAIAGGFDNVRERVEALTGVIGDDAVRASDKFQDNLVLLQAFTESLGREFSVGLLPSLNGALDASLKWAAANRELISSDVAGFAGAIAGAVELAAKAVTPLYNKLAGVAKILAFIRMGPAAEGFDAAPTGPTRYSDEGASEFVGPPVGGTSAGGDAALAARIAALRAAGKGGAAAARAGSTDRTAIEAAREAAREERDAARQAAEIAKDIQAEARATAIKQQEAAEAVQAALEEAAYNFRSMVVDYVGTARSILLNLPANAKLGDLSRGITSTVGGRIIDKGLSDYQAGIGTGFARYEVPATPSSYNADGTRNVGTAAVAGGMSAGGYAAIVVAAIGAITEATARANALRGSVSQQPYGTGLISSAELRLTAQQGAISGSLSPFLGEGAGNAIGKLLGKSGTAGYVLDQIFTGGWGHVLGQLFSAPTVEKQLATQVEKQFKDAGLLWTPGGSQTRRPGENAAKGGWQNMPADGALVRGEDGLFEVQGGKFVVPTRNAGLNSLYSGLQTFAKGQFGTEDYADTRWADAFLNRARQLGYTEDQAKQDFLQLAHANGITVASQMDTNTKNFIYQASQSGQANGTGGFRPADSFTQEAYFDAIKETAKLFAEDLPAGVDAANIAFESLVDGNGKLIVSMKKFDEILNERVGIFASLKTGLSGIAGGGVSNVLNALLDGGSSAGGREAIGSGLQQLLLGTAQGLAASSFTQSAAFKPFNEALAKLAVGDLSGLGGVRGGISSLVNFSRGQKPIFDAINYAFLPEALGGMSTGFTDAASAARRSILSPRKQRGALLGDLGGIDGKIQALLADDVISDSEAAEFQSLVGRRGAVGSDIAALGGKRNVRLGASILDETAALAKRSATLVERQNGHLERLNGNFDRLISLITRGGVTRGGIDRGEDGSAKSSSLTRAQIRSQMMGRR